MKLRNLPARIVFATILATSAVMAPQHLHAQAVSAEQASQNAFQFFSAGQYENALKAYEQVIKDYPTSLIIWDARFRAGYLQYLLGDFDKSLAHLRAIKDPAPKEVQELAASVIPQALAGKAAREDDEKKKEAGLRDALKAYDHFLTTYPSSDQLETVHYGRALCAFQIGEFAQAIEGLRRNVQQFPRSETVQDSQYLLALALATEGAEALQKNSGDAAALAKFDEALKILQGIIDSKQNVALMNDAQFQIGELFFNRAMLGPKEQQEASFAQALSAYRTVQSEGPMIKAQEARIKGINDRRLQAGRNRDVATFKRLERVEDNERAKLEALKAKGDLTLPAHLKTAQIFFHQKGYDESRVLLRHIQQFAQEEAQKKAIQYFLTLTYSSQGLREQAVAAYDQFQSAYKGDPMADNLPLVIGALFLAEPADPAKATQYFEEGTKLYPKGRFAAETINAQATALLQQRRFDEATKAYEAFLKTNPPVDQAVQAEFGIATVLRETRKLPEAVAAFKKIRDAHPDTPQGEQAAFWVGQIALMSNDFPTVIKELGDFLTKYPESELLPNAKYSLAQAETPKNKPRALELYKQIGEEAPDTQIAPYTYFQRASLLAADQKFDEVTEIYKEFIKRYPESPMLFNAYQTLAQIRTTAGDLPGAIAFYDEMVANHPQDPNTPQALLLSAQLWMQYNEAQGRYLALNEEQRAEWNRGIEGSLKAGEKLLTDYPASTQVALALKTLLANQRQQVNAELKKDEDITKYFEDLAARFESNPETRSKVLFTLASYTYGKDKEKAIALMTEAYDPQLVYAPDDIDLFGAALLDSGKVAESAEVYTKLGTDYPNPQGVDPTRAPGPVQEAQAISLYGRAKALRTEGKADDALKLFEDLKRLYPWSPKLLEANYEIAEGHYRSNQHDEAIGLLIGIIRSNTAAPEIGAKALLLLGKIQEAQGDIPSAIDQYIKVFAFYEGVEEPAAEGLWLGGQLLEKQAATLPDTAPPKSKGPTKPGQLAKAHRAYKDLVEKYPSSQYVAEAKKRLEALPAPPARR